jgi:ribosomal protein L7/L12
MQEVGMSNIVTEKQTALAAAGGKPAPAADGATVMAPIILSLGKKKNKAIKRLKRGKGSAMDELMGVVEQVQKNLGEQAAGKLILPVVVIYSKKQRRIRGLF